jgi:hypothetical protein
LLGKIFQKSAESALNVSYQNSYSGLGSDLLNVAEDDKKLQDWKEEQLTTLADLLEKKKIMHEEYADAVVSIEDTMKKNKRSCNLRIQWRL